MNVHTLVAAIRNLAERLPTGLVDLKALVKMETEQAELAQELFTGNTPAILSEVADVVYYAGKAHLNELLDAQAMEQVMREAMEAAGITDYAQVLQVLQAKYETRLRVGKNHDAEDAAVAEVARSLGLG